ncbi:MAG: Hpt domain-containing protein, partial [Bradymonadia bacterium]
MDMSSFLATFFEESREGLDQMETGLLAFDAGNADPELINVIFRAAHSLKGGSATFGFDAVTELTHEMETLLDQIREGQRTVTPATITVLLESVDVLRGLMGAIQGGESPDAQGQVQLVERLKAMLDGSDAPAEVAATATASKAWSVDFLPLPHLLKTGNDPVRILRELGQLGELQLEVDFSRLPALSDLEPDECHLGWRARLEGGEGLEARQIKEIFDWVEDDCVLEVSPLSSEPAAAHSERKASPEDASASKSTAKMSVDTRSIRVDTHKIDTLMNMVGQLVITQSMLSQLGEQ